MFVNMQFPGKLSNTNCIRVPDTLHLKSDQSFPSPDTHEDTI